MADACNGTAPVGVSGGNGATDATPEAGVVDNADVTTTLFQAAIVDRVYGTPNPLADFVPQVWDLCKRWSERCWVDVVTVLDGGPVEATIDDLTVRISSSHARTLIEISNPDGAWVSLCGEDGKVDRPADLQGLCGSRAEIIDMLTRSRSRWNAAEIQRQVSLRFV